MALNIKPLKPGKYFAKTNASNTLQAAMNGISAAHPESIMDYNGIWCRFYIKGKNVFDCNPIFAQAHFTLTQTWYRWVKCCECGKRTAPRLPRSGRHKGDGTCWLPRRHRINGVLCPGSLEEGELIEKRLPE